ncbi:MAG: lactate dehydrogenase [Spirochaetota bacterium]|nr:lactate dehydrogenase [Spirochaetota bacterium]
MKIVSYGVRPIEESFFHKLNTFSYILDLVPELLTNDNIHLCQGADVVMLRSNCNADKNNLIKMKELGIKYILTRTVGYDHIDLKMVKELEFELCARIPSYSPTAVSELAVSIALGLSRKTIAMTMNTSHKDYKIYNNYFSKEIRHSTVGVIGTGRIGICSVKAFLGLGAKVLGYDPYPSEEIKSIIDIVDLDTLLQESDIILLHTPYFKDSNYHFVNEQFINKMKNNSILINTARGELVDLKAILKGIKSGKLAGVGLDVLENENMCFFRDNTDQKLQDPIIEELSSYYPRVIITPHVGSFTEVALTNMIEISYQNLDQFLKYGFCDNTLI